MQCKHACPNPDGVFNQSNPGELKRAMSGFVVVMRFDVRLRSDPVAAGSLLTTTTGCGLPSAQLDCTLPRETSGSMAEREECQGCRTRREPRTRALDQGGSGADGKSVLEAGQESRTRAL